MRSSCKSAQFCGYFKKTNHIKEAKELLNQKKESFEQSPKAKANQQKNFSTITNSPSPKQSISPLLEKSTTPTPINIDFDQFEDNYVEMDQSSINSNASPNISNYSSEIGIQKSINLSDHQFMNNSKYFWFFWISKSRIFFKFGDRTII